MLQAAWHRLRTIIQWAWLKLSREPELQRECWLRKMQLFYQQKCSKRNLQHLGTIALDLREAMEFRMLVPRLISRLLERNLLLNQIYSMEKNLQSYKLSSFLLWQNVHPSQAIHEKLITAVTGMSYSKSWGLRLLWINLSNCLTLIVGIEKGFDFSPCDCGSMYFRRWCDICIWSVRDGQNQKQPGYGA